MRRLSPTDRILLAAILSSEHRSEESGIVVFVERNLTYTVLYQIPNAPSVGRSGLSLEGARAEIDRLRTAPPATLTEAWPLAGQEVADGRP